MTNGPTIIILRVDPVDNLAYARYAALLTVTHGASFLTK